MQEMVETKSLNKLIKNLPLMNALFCEVNPMPIKYAMKLAGFDCGNCRLPLTELSDKSKRILENLIQ